MAKNPITLFVNISALGDVIGAEPALRFAVTHTFKDVSNDILIASVYPELFSHLPKLNMDVEVLHTDEINSEIEKYHMHLDRTIFRTNPDPQFPENNVHNFAQTAMHTVDFVSLHLLKIILPDDQKHILLPEPSYQEIDSITEKFSKLNLDISKTLLVHPGITWPSRTIPFSWWKKFLKLYKHPVCLIGKTSKTCYLDCLDKKYKPGVFKYDGYPSLINKLSLRELTVAIAKSWGLITNDSSPFHLASAFHNYLFTFATSREWYKLEPHNHDKSYNLVHKFPFDNKYWCPLLPKQRVDKLPSGISSLEECIWTPEEAYYLISACYASS